jgi:putative toxin-antitoxin system antitoxin component (TIGR02293 family)
MNTFDAVVDLLGGVAALGGPVRTLADLDLLVAKGLPRSALDRVLAAAAPVSKRVCLRNRVLPRASYQRSPTLSAEHSATAERLARVTALVGSVWEDAARTQRFLWTPHPELAGRVPIEIALTELVAREVEEPVRRALNGLPV